MNFSKFLSANELPNYNELTPKSVEEILDKLIPETKNLIKTINQNKNSSWETIIEPISVETEKINRIWGACNHLSSVIDSPEWRKLINNKMPMVTNFWTELTQDEKLYKKIDSLKKNNFIQSNLTKKKVVSNYLKEFKLGGTELKKNEKKKFKTNSTMLAELSQKYSENLLDSTKESYIHLSSNSLKNQPNRLNGIPEHVIKAAKENASQKKLSGAIFNLLLPTYIPIMQYADDRGIRFNMFSKYSRRASELSDEGSIHDNLPIIGKILKLRYEQAKLLGFKNPAEMSLYSKMAESPDEVIKFLRNLAKKAKPFAEAEFKELNLFANKNFKLNNLQPWDIPYVSEKLKKQLFDFSEEELRNYFPLKKVLIGLFDTVEKLFNCKIKESTKRNSKEKWHSSVKIFEFSKKDNIFGHLFIDLFARETKRGGAWMDESRCRKQLEKEKIQHPIALVNCNFSNSTDGREVYLTHDEVITLFHEFGHALHHLLTEVNEIEISGINGVEWDAVELPSQFLENFAWEFETLKKISCHKKTNKSIPKKFYNKIIEAKNFNSGMQMLRQIEFSLFDILIHSKISNISKLSEEEVGQNVYKILSNVRDEVSVITQPSFSMFPNSFSHIFNGGYAAGYYSYKWAEVLSADCYSKFENKSNKIREKLGEKFRKQILSKGGSRDAIESFKCFMNREPNINALLKHSGLKN